MADWNLPGLTDLYTNVLTYLKNRLNDVVTMLDSTLTTPTNLPTGAKRWNSTTNKWEKWTGSAWADMAGTYAISISGNAATATAATTAAALSGNISESQVTNLATDLAAKAPLASPTFTGTVTAPTFSGNLSGNATSATTAAACTGNAATATSATTATNATTVGTYSPSLTPTANTIPVRGSTGYVNQIYNGAFSGLTAAGISISGLNFASYGDGVFDIYISAKLTTANDDYFRLVINGDSTAANYVSNTYFGASYSDAVPAIGALYGSSVTRSFYHIRIYVASGQYRLLRFWAVSDSPSQPFFQGGSIWKNSSNITQLKFYSNSGYIIADGATVTICKVP